MNKLVLITFLLLTVIPNFAAVPSTYTVTPSTNVNPAPLAQQQQLLLYALTHRLTVRQYQHLVGKRLTLKQKISYVLLKHKLIKAYGEDETGSAIGGFLLGFTLGLIGVAITYIFSRNRTFRKWSWIGFGAWVVLFLIILLIVAASLGGYN